MPAYNCLSTLGISVNSVLNQFFENWELLIVDDCSDENIESYLKKNYNDCRIKYYKTVSRTGPGAARNIGLKYATGDYVAFLDADDLWDVNKLKKQVDFMSQNSVGICFSDYRIIDSVGKIKKKNIGVPVRVSYKDLLCSNVMGCLTVVLDKKKNKPIEFQTNIKHEDYALWLKLLKNNSYAYAVTDVLASYRVTSGSFSSNKLEVAKYQWRIYREVEKISFSKSVYYFLYYLFKGFMKRL